MRIQSNRLSLISLVLLCLIVQAVTYKKEMEVLQASFMKHFCGDCPLDGPACQENIRYIASLPETGHFNAANSPLSNNPYKISTITFQNILVKDAYFEFPNEKQNSVRELSGLLALPDVDGQINGLVVYFHPTTFDKAFIPTNEKENLYQTIAAMYAASNLAVMFPDYLGYGADEKNVHPYVLFPQQNARSANYLLNAAVRFLEAKYGNRTRENPWPVMAAGYSQGGAYAIFFSACNSQPLRKSFPYCSKGLQLSEVYKIYAVAGLDGAYDPFGVVKGYLFGEVGPGVNNNEYRAQTQLIINTAKPALAALTILSYGTYSKNPFPMSAAFVDKFFNMRCLGTQNICNIDGQNLNLEQALQRPHVPNGKIGLAIARSAMGKQNNGYSYAKLAFQATSHKNSIYALVNKPLFQTEDFTQTLKSATIVDYGDVTPHPILVFSLALDSVVSPLNTINFSKHNKSGKVRSYLFENKNHKRCPAKVAVNVDHLGGEAIANIFAINFFNQKRFSPK